MAGSMPLRSGVHQALEDAADELIRSDLKRHTRHTDNDVLTPWKAGDRYRHEVYVTDGVPDAALRQGIYNRVTNPARPELNSRDGHARPRRSMGAGPDLDDHGGRQ